ncbi:hypothetical protein Csa_005738 [Cucumis sativus]|uniref:Uncharacterized protein n=1 Tax=Cucumis sativus TaxID=3659 RepID=A0A0A0K9W7_CUCSA|nr:hypothetical protein Csa_005738 [Cucumis sativus]
MKIAQELKQFYKRYEHSQRLSTRFSFATPILFIPLLCTLNFAAFSLSLITFHLFSQHCPCAKYPSY